MNPFKNMQQITLEDQLQKLVNLDENVCYSPMSLQIALAMVYMAADGEAKLELEKLGVDKLPEFDYTDKDLAPSTEDDWGMPAPIVQFANSVWTSKHYELQDDYAASLAEKYNARSGVVDPETAKQCADMINDWVSQKTAGRIQDLVPEGVIDEDLVTIIVNALYIRASWWNSFEESATHDQTFFAPSGERQVAMMNQIDELGYCKTDSIEAVSLETMRDYALICVKADELSDAIIDPHSLAFSRTNIDLALPKFKIETSLKLKDMLADLGVSSIFSPSHDFDRMVKTDKKLFVSEILQKTFIEVHEKGLEAAAATAVIMVAECARMSPPPPMNVRFDRPFMYYLVDTKNKVTLFAGALVDPSI